MFKTTDNLLENYTIDMLMCDNNDFIIIIIIIRCRSSIAYTKIEWNIYINKYHIIRIC